MIYYFRIETLNMYKKGKMNIETLKYFAKVYEKKSVNSAAKELFITPQGLSKMIKQLEKDLGAELFNRGSGGVVATEVGHILYEKSKDICYLLESVKKEIDNIKKSKDEINILTTYAITSALDADFIFDFTKVYPDIDINLRELPDECDLERMIHEGIDVVMFIDNEKNSKNKLILEGEVVIAVSKNHHLAVNDEISVKDLINEPLILKKTEKQNENIFVSECLRNGFKPKVKYEISNLATAHRLCETNEIAYVSIDFVENVFINNDLKIIKLKERIPQNIYLKITSGDANKLDVVSLFKDYINKEK